MLVGHASYNNNGGGAVELFWAPAMPQIMQIGSATPTFSQPSARAGRRAPG